MQAGEGPECLGFDVNNSPRCCSSTSHERLGDHQSRGNIRERLFFLIAFIELCKGL